eukprot:3236152-Heterocapsa_arctica.AAC.1
MHESEPWRWQRLHLRKANEAAKTQILESSIVSMVFIVMVIRLAEIVAGGDLLFEEKTAPENDDMITEL